MSRKKIAAGNWKMNNDFEEAMELTRSVSHMDVPDDVQVILGVPYVFLKASLDVLLHVKGVDVAAQNCHQNEKGAYTGEISASMLSSLSVPYVIIGHSERRAYFNEDNEILTEKDNQALENNLNIIIC